MEALPIPSAIRRLISGLLALAVGLRPLYLPAALAFFSTRDVVANATAPACTILHNPLGVGEESSR
jgi:hypothetical protein